MLRVIIATKNDGKIAEIKRILGLPGLELVTYRDLREWPEVEEHGESFFENALIKARVTGVQTCALPILRWRSCG